MTKKRTGGKEPTSSHGGYRWELPPEERRVRINVTLSPETIKLLEPFTRTGKRGKLIDVAVQAYLIDPPPEPPTDPQIEKIEQELSDRRNKTAGAEALKGKS